MRLEGEAGERADEDRFGTAETVLAAEKRTGEVQRRLAEEEEEAVRGPEGAAQIGRVAIEVIEIADPRRVFLVEDVEKAADAAEMHGAAAADEPARTPVGDPQRVVGVLAPEEVVAAGRATARDR